tara:strand:- start:14136 stop:14915 length:780 start_codon:yes stop_codon:yes gene_type:complete
MTVLLQCKGRAQTGGLNIEVINAGKPGAVRNCPPSDRVNMGINLAQLAICFATFFRNGDITPLILVVGATFILEGIATLPLWFVHSFSARTDGGKNLTYALMRGKGHRNVFVICNVASEAWNLEGLSSDADSSYDYRSTHEVLAICAAFPAFVCVCLTSTYLPKGSAFAMLQPLVLGTAGNVLVATLPRQPWMHGINLTSLDVIYNGGKVMKALQTLEDKYENTGQPLVKQFFPAGLPDDEQKWWDDRKEKHKLKKEAE